MDSTSYAIVLAIRDEYMQAVEQMVTEDMPKIARDVEKALKDNYEKYFEEANKRLAIGAKEAVLAAYDERVEARKRFPSYRVGWRNRLSGGVLFRALSDDANYVGTAHEILIGNTDLLDKEAWHWRRLNYGAGQAGSTGEKIASIPVSIAGVSLGTWTPDTKGPRGDMYRPVGRVLTSEVGGLQPGFYPIGKVANILTPGIQARRFLQDGAISVARNLDREYRDVVVRLEEAVERAPKHEITHDFTVRVKGVFRRFFGRGR